MLGDCLYIADNVSDAADQITKTSGSNTSLCSVSGAMFKFDLDWSDGGATPSVYLLLIGPKGMGGVLAGHGVFTVALSRRVIRCGSTNYLTERKPRSFNFTVDI